MSLADERNTDLAFNTDVLRECGNKYADIASDLTDLVTRLSNCLNDLTTVDWTTPAGIKFAEMAKENWKDNIERYIDLLKTLRDILYEAAQSYDDLVQNHIEKTKL